MEYRAFRTIIPIAWYCAPITPVEHWLVCINDRICAIAVLNPPPVFLCVGRPLHLDLPNFAMPSSKEVCICGETVGVQIAYANTTGFELIGYNSLGYSADVP